MEEENLEEIQDNSDKKTYADKSLPYAMLTILVLAVLGCIILIGQALEDIKNKIDTNSNNIPQKAFQNLESKNSEKNYKELTNNNSQIVRLKINPLEEYNGKTKSEMYELRKDYVKTSMFYTPDYKPNEEIFGGIVDGKKWWGLNPLVCSRENEDNTKGISALSRFINTPDLLVQTYFPFNLKYDAAFKEYCEGEFARNIPEELTYNRQTNTITAKYNMSPFIYQNTLNYFDRSRIHYPLILSGLNARDFGYDYMKIDKLHNITMLNEANAYTDIYKFRDFIHLGSSCKHPEGCNNISPRQTELEFNINSLPAEMDIKLWKSKPLIPQLKADINFRIVFEEDK